jgi:hypothetical protein
MLTQPHARKIKQLEVMKWWNYFFDDVMSDANL